MSKPKLNLHVRKAGHFLTWEVPYFERHFELVDTPADDAVLLAFGPDALESAIAAPARLRVAYLFPGFGYNPYRNLIHRTGMMRLIEAHFALVFANPGPLAEVFKGSPKLRVCPFTIDIDRFQRQNVRTRLGSLLHASARGAPQKDWQRSQTIMALTAIPYEVFPPRVETRLQAYNQRLRRLLIARKLMSAPPVFHKGYESHEALIERYYRHDGFVHVAAEVPGAVDGKYTATLMEAGLAGCLLFWHDTFQLGNDFETVFDLPLDPAEAAQQICAIRDSIDIHAHSRRTREEMIERVRPDKSIAMRAAAIQELLD